MLHEMARRDPICPNVTPRHRRHCEVANGASAKEANTDQMRLVLADPLTCFQPLSARVCD